MANDAELSFVPKLRFPEFRGDNGWEERTLGEAALFHNGRAYKQEELLERGKYKVLRVGNFFTNDSWYFSNLELDEAKYCDKGDLLYAWSASFGPRIWMGDKTIYHYHIWKVEQQGDVDKSFLFITLDNETKRMKAQSTNGLGLLHITKGNIEKWRSYFPDKAEQKKIAECLSTLDELIVATSQKLDALKAHKKGLMQQLFPREGETLPRLRFPEFQNSGGWAKMALGQAATFYNGRAYKQEELLESGKYPVLRVGNFFTSNTWYYSDLELDETKYCEEGDLLYAWSASFGPRIWRGERSIYHYHIWKVIEQRGIEKQFLFITLENETENMKAKTTNGLGIMHITKGAIESWESAFPTLAEQRKIAGCLTSIDNKIISQIKKLEALKIHKGGLMQQLFPLPDAIQS